MADGNDGEYEANSFNANADDSSGATEKQLGKAGRKKRPCCCIPGIKKKCKSCLLQQQLNSTAYRNRQKDDIVQYRKERDEERSKVASLKGQLEAYQCSFTDSLQQRSRRCSNCGMDVEPVMLASEVPCGGTLFHSTQ
ncbi:hypothetical protein AAVH_29562 [Aphelenchoides avenae]|nr:hypothetical protein AAVH_29562 [Aphelenchus avenae]